MAAATDITVSIQLIGGARLQLQVRSSVSVGALQEAVATTVSRPAGSFKLVVNGKSLSADERSVVRLAPSDVLLVVPVRKSTSPRLVTAALEAQHGARRSATDNDDDDGDDDEDEPAAQLPPTAADWEKAVIATARRRLPEGVVEALIVLRPVRLLVLPLFVAGCLLFSRLGLGPPFILIAIIATIFCNLGKRKPGEASAYSIFNPGVRRLPGQLDAGQIDQQIRRGQL